MDPFQHPPYYKYNDLGKEVQYFIGSISNFEMAEWTPEGQADQTPKSLGLRIIRRLRETFVVNENEVFIGLGASGVNP